MASDGTLSPGVIDVFLRAVDQAPGSRSGPTGRLTDLRNGLVTQYNAGQGKPQRIKVKQRNGFATLPTTGHSAATGAPDNTIAWSNPELLSTLGSQLLSIANAIPRVYDGTDWTHYASERVVSNVLTESVYHTSQHTLQAQDHAWKGGVTCSVWVETPGGEDPRTVIFIGFRADDGTWVRPPILLYDPSEPATDYASMARVIADDEDDRFWVVFNQKTTGSKFQVELYNLDGEHLSSNNAVAQIWDEFPGYWDITQIPGGGVFLAQPLHTAAEEADGVQFAAYTQTADVISAVVTSNDDIKCRGPVAWLTNDLGDLNWYLATVGLGEGPGGKLWAYQISPPSPNPFAHEYNFQIDIPGQAYPDSLIGFASEGVEEDEPSVTVSFTVLPLQAASAGPLYDPQLRYSKVYECTFNDARTLHRQNDFTCQVSRAFKHDDEYYSINYYQSGSGRTQATNQIAVDFTEGDFMLGPPSQPLTVLTGDYTTGSPKTYLKSGGITIHVTSAVGSFGISGGDTVEMVYLPFGTNSSDGTFLCLKWTLASLSTTNAAISGGRLVIAGSDIPSANGTWDICGGAIPGPANYVYTFTGNTDGATVVPGTFGAGGTAQIDSMAYYSIFDLALDYDLSTFNFLIDGDMVVSGNPTPANNGTKTIERAIVTRRSPLGMGFDEGIWITRGSEVSSTGSFTAVVNPDTPNVWHFETEFGDQSDIGCNLVVSNDRKANNNDSFEITDYTLQDVTVTASAITAEVFESAFLPNVSVDLPVDKTPFTFFLQGLTVDYSLKGAYLVVAGDSIHSENNGTYQIIDIDPDPSHHIIYCKPADGSTGQRNQQFVTDGQTITIFTQTNVQQEYQPCWLMVPLTGSKPVIGRWEYGIAYADWRLEGSDPPFGPNLYTLHVTSPVRRETDWTFMLPYRAISFTVGQTLVTASGQVVNGAVSSSASTVGLKQFYFSDNEGLSTQTNGSLLLPGPMCGEFTASGFHEQAVNFGFEAPFIVEQDESDNNVALRKGGTYQYVAVAEITDENGDRVFSVVSPPANVTLSGDNNVVVLGGRMLQPLDGDGLPFSVNYGVTNWSLVGISIYRTAYQDGVPTAERHKITLDLNVNGLAPVSATNDSGFDFPDEFTWNYRDENIDASVLSGEVLYTDKGYLPRFAAPAQRQGVLWKNRAWVIGYDGAVWMSGEKNEGDALWFFPLFRYTQAVQDVPIALAPMDDYLIVLCEKDAVWYIPSAQFPDSTGRNGSLPAMVKTTFTNGCTGHAVPIQDGVAYSSTAGGVWTVTRGLRNVWLSQPYQESLGQIPITGLAVDEMQRLHVATFAGSFYFVYDQVVQEWSRWNMPTSSYAKLAILDGQAVFQDPAHVWLYTPLTFADNLTGSPVAIALDITLSSLNFANVRGLKSVWEMQIVGDYKGEHHLNAEISYPDDDPDNPTVFPDPDDGPYTPDPDQPYLMAINPMIEQASSYGLRIFADFVGISEPGDSFELELISCEVGIEGQVGLNKFVDSRRIAGA